jgi:hypothetical protein
MIEYLSQLYEKIQREDDEHFALIANESIWPEYLYKMREGKFSVQILTEISSLDVMYALKKYKQMMGGE